MGRFVVTRTAAGDRFLLQGEGGRTLAVSRYYANLDACKKGMRSLCRFAPVAPVVDVGAGEYADNPKFALYGGEGWRFELMAANGKSVIVSPEYATKKACLRAISMLKGGVGKVEAVLSEPAGFRPLTLPPAAEEPVGTTPRKPRKKAPVRGLNATRPAKGQPAPTETIPAHDPGAAPAATNAPTPPAERPAPEAPVSPAPEAPAAPAQKRPEQAGKSTVPRLIRLTPAKSQPAAPAKKTQDAKQSGWLDRFLKR